MKKSIKYPSMVFPTRTKGMESKQPTPEQIETGWELQDKLLAMTVLNQTAPKIVLTNDECGWNISYFPDAPYTDGEISLMKGNPLEAVKALWEVIHE